MLKRVSNAHKHVHNTIKQNMHSTAQHMQTSTSSRRVIPDRMKAVCVLNIPHVRHFCEVVDITIEIVKHRLAPELPEVSAP